MKLNNLQVACAAARLFLDRAIQIDVTQKYISPSKESGALRRASMDLTRALAELRKP